jgi:hypothetical protein
MKQLGYLINGIEFIPQHIADKCIPFGQYPDQTIEVVWSLDDERDALDIAHDRIRQLEAECKAWMNAVADAVEPYGYDRGAACGPADLLPGLADITAHIAEVRAERDDLRAMLETVRDEPLGGMSKCKLPVPGAPDYEAHCDCWFDAGEDERIPCCWCGYPGTDIRVWCMSKRRTA